MIGLKLKCQLWLARSLLFMQQWCRMHHLKVFLAVFVVVSLMTVGIEQSSEVRITRHALSLHRYYGDHMVFHHDTAPCFSGLAIARTVVTASLGQETVSVYANESGDWRVCFTPRTIRSVESFWAVSGAANVSLVDVRFGQVYLCSGQSNMVFYMKKSIGGTAALRRASRFPLIRLYRVKQVSSKEREYNMPEESVWELATASALKEFSSLCYYFAREIYNDVGHGETPIGLVEAAWSGTMIQPWSTTRGLQKCNVDVDEFPSKSVLKSKYSQFGSDEHQAPSVIYNAMIHPLFSLNIALQGILWYQGESNALYDEATLYRCLFPSLIEEWRRESGNALVPFIYAELAAYTNKSRGRLARIPPFSHLEDLRLAQESALALPWVGVATAVDLGDPRSPFDPIHPRDKATLAKRFYRVAQSMIFGRTISHTGPKLTEALCITTLDAPAVLWFDEVAGELSLGPTANCRTCCEVNPFEYSFDNNVWKRSTEMEVLSSGRQIKVGVDWPRPREDGKRCEPLWLRYAYDPYPQCLVYGGDGLPARPFVASIDTC